MVVVLWRVELIESDGEVVFVPHLCGCYLWSLPNLFVLDTLENCGGLMDQRNG